MATIATVVAFNFLGVAQAATISLTGGSSGGNPGGQPLYEVSGLVEGDAFNVSWGGVSGLSIDGMVTIDSLTATDAVVRVMLENNSPEISNGDPRVTSFGLLIEDFTALTDSNTGGTYLDNADDGNFPGFSTDVCGTSGNNCAGGGNGGIDSGDSDDFTLEVSGNFGGTLTLENFALKVQGGPAGASFELAGVPTPKPNQDNIPEPASYILLIGLAGAAALRRLSA